MEELDASPIVYFWATELGIALVLAPIALRAAGGPRAAALRSWRVDRRSALAVALLSGFAYILVLYALRLAPVSYVAPARESSVLFGAALGVGVLGEGDRRRRLGVRRRDRRGNSRAGAGLARRRAPVARHRQRGEHRDQIRATRARPPTRRFPPGPRSRARGWRRPRW